MRRSVVRAHRVALRRAGLGHDAEGRRSLQGFTLIEVLVVVAIIALLVAILIPSLAKARELARTTKCMAQLSNFPKAVHTFSVEHRGYAQGIGTVDEWNIIDREHKRYDYQLNFFTATGLYLKPWPLAYAAALGDKGFKRAEQLFTTDASNQNNPTYYYSRFPKREIFLCPSDKDPVHNVWSPNGSTFGPISYAANEDVFGFTNPPGGSSPGEGQPWADGTSGDGPGVRAKRLEGKMDALLDPSSLVMFSDGGNEDTRTEPCLLLTNNNGGQIIGPYIENFEWAAGRLPHFRHLAKGGLATVEFDGSGKMLKALQWCRKPGKNAPYVKRYGPRMRISPYRVGLVNPDAQPGPGAQPG